MSRTAEEQLVHFISDMYTVEQQALAQMVSAPELAGDPKLASDFRQHHLETEEHAAAMLKRLEAHGGKASAIKEAVMKLGGKGFLLFARLMPETPGRLAAHSYSYEAMEWAGYEMLIRFAEEAGDVETVAAAKKIRDQEREMMERLERDFDVAEEASHRDTPPEKLADHLLTHLAEAHALEVQGIRLLNKSKEIAEDLQLAKICDANLEKSREHAEALERRLNALGGTPSALKDSALALGGLNWGFFFQAQSDTPAKLAAFAYAYEHLKIAGYELLGRTALRAGDPETERLCSSLVAEERSMTEHLTSTFTSAVEATLAAVARTAS